MVRAVCFIDGSYAINEDDLVTFGGEKYLVFKIEKIFDFFGNLEGYKVFLKSR